MKKIFLIVSFVFTLVVKAQGCSDAGACFISTAFNATEKELKNDIEVATIFGKGEQNISYFSPYVSYSRRFSEKFSLNTKVTFSSANGSFGTRASFGDAFLIGNYNFEENKQKQWSILGGWKFPFTSSNLKINEFSLPLDYQASLGTFDLFLGTNLKYKKWDFSAVVQIPVFNNNKNSYFKEFSDTDDFPSTNLFKRKSDALVGASYSLKTINQKFTFKPNLQFIYHLGEDRFENIFGQEERIKNSDGLTVNGSVNASYHFNTKSSLSFLIATPFVVRDIRPDGLTRSIVLGLFYKVSF
ncbi:MAG: hypothetical protein B7Y83_09010 [Flavobacteriales bacterium 32-34-25]|nr:MAG: hypothetical protein B7Y83_09010 [Flavobacteriales bacterium 32-34-25]